MPQFGDTFSELFGDAIAPIETHEADSQARVVYALRKSVDFRKIIAIFTAKIQEIENVQRGITPEMLFDIPTAYGPQLDQLGSILCLPREGWDDAKYRVYLRTQALLVLPNRRGQPNMLAVIRSLMDTSTGTIGYREYVPKSYEITVQSATLGQLSSWIRFLEKCRPATYIPVLGWIPEDPFGYANESATIAYTLNPFANAQFKIVVDTKYAGILPL